MDFPAEAGLVFGGELQPLDEGADCLPRDRMASREFLQALVGVGKPGLAHHGLDGFGEHFPVAVEVGGDALPVDLCLAETLLRGEDGDQ